MSISESCCTTPPAGVDEYVEKGDYTQVNGLKTYITGPTNAKKGILIVYDIFGFCHQTIRGADILAYSHAENQYRVVVPDFLDGAKAEPSWFPLTEETKAKVLALISGPADVKKALERIPSLLIELSKKEGITEWGAVGMCWGGKVVVLASRAQTGFKVASQVHPSRLDRADAEKVTIPFAILASGDEPADEVEAFGKALTVPKYVETFKDQIHGWMGARGNLADPKVRKEYERGYQTLLEFFEKNF